MRNDSLISTDGTPTEESRLVLRSLDIIAEKLDKELAAKQKIIEAFIGKMTQLEHSLEEKSTTLAEKEEHLKECLKQGEGNKQLINKLLGDIERLNQDIEWYKRTYEKRSFWGTVKEKLLMRKKR